MLQQLLIKNIALIDCAEINFTKGLNVLSGETGSGKSVIIESLNFALGAKADKTLIRNGENECFVQAVFDVSKNLLVKDIFEDFEYEVEDDLIITRKFTIDGKSTIKINGNTANASMLKRFTSALVDVHGQSEHFNLLKTSNQLSLIDKFGGQEIATLKEKIKEEFTQYKDVKTQLNQLGGDEQQRLIRLDILTYQINEIEKAELKDNEEDDLLTIKEKLKHQEKIVTALNAVKSAVSSEGGISDILSNVVRISDSITDFGDEYLSINERLNSIFAEIEDVGDTTNSLIEDFDFSEYNINEIEDRLEIIKSLKKKYGGSIPEIYQFFENAKEEKEKLENFNQLNEKLLIEKEKIESKLYTLYLELHNLRKVYTERFSLNILAELKELGMPKAQFLINFNQAPSQEDCKFDSANGIDELEFFFSANLGEPLKPLSQVISGGEMSRFMLAIKAQTAKYNQLSTFIFDEIDAGISGVIAKVVAEKFVKISKDAQIIAISHLPQISVMADNNLLIKKTEGDDKTVTSVVQLSKDDKIIEIIRLVGGDINSKSAIAHAEDLIKTAQLDKERILKA